MKSRYFTTDNKIFKKNKIFIFPYAGGGASAFRNWQKEFDNTEIIAAQYPGRETRVKDQLIDNMEVLVREVFEDIKKLISGDTPYFLFGHSLGTKVAYELALLIQKSPSLIQPSGLIISAGKAPCYKEVNPIHKLDNTNFAERVSKIEGTPKEILENKAWLEFFIPMLRADFKMDELYHREKAEKINCPILALMGTQDSELTLEELLMWREYTNGEFSYISVEGGHMFINTNQSRVISAISEFIEVKNT